MSIGVGSRLKEVRQKLRMTQKQFGEKFGVNASAVAKYEKGVNFPNRKMFNILGFQYNVSMDYLLCGRGTLFYEDQNSKDSTPLRNKPGGDKEMEELFSLMSQVPFVRHSIIGYFLRFKLKNRELLEKELTKDSLTETN